MLKKLLPLAFVFQGFFGSGQTLTWKKAFDGVQPDQVSDFWIDPGENIYTVGLYRDSLHFNTVSGPVDLVGVGYDDIFILKSDSNGNHIWAKSIGGYCSGQFPAITGDGLGNIYITGSFSDSVDLDPSGGAFMVTSNGGYDILLASYDSSGNFIWGQSIGSSSHDLGVSLEWAGSDKMVLAGMFSDTIDLDTDTGILVLNNIGLADIFFAGFNTDGTPNWGANIGGVVYPNSYTYFRKMTLDPLGNIFLIGEHGFNTDFDPGPDSMILGGFSTRRMFLAKYSPTGQFAWSSHFPNFQGLGDNCLGISLNENRSISLSGIFRISTDFDPGPDTFKLETPTRAFFLANYDSLGNLNWAKKMDCISTGVAGQNWVYSLFEDNHKNIHICGSVAVADFDPGPGTAIPVNADSSDGFWASYDSLGNFLNVITIAGQGEDLVRAFYKKENGKVLMAGAFSQSVDFDIGTDTSYLYSIGATGGFLAEYFTCVLPSFDTISLNACDQYYFGQDTLSVSGNYSGTFTGYLGCDSSVALALTINPSSFFSFQDSVCVGRFSPDGLVFWDSTGMFLDTLSNALGCDSVLQVNLFVQDSGFSTVFQFPDSLIATSAGDQNLWMDCATQLALPGYTANTFSPPYQGWFALVQNLNGCLDTSDCYFTGPNSILEPNISFWAGPNPFINSVQISWENYMEIKSIKMFDQLGRQIQVVSSIGEKSITLFLDSSESGIYFLEINTPQWIVRKILIRL